MPEPLKSDDETHLQNLQEIVRRLFTTKVGIGIVTTAVGVIGAAWWNAKPPDPSLAYLERQTKAQEETLSLHKASIEANQKALEAAQKAGPQADPILDELKGIHGELAKISAQGDVPPPVVQPKAEEKKPSVPFKFKD